MTAWKRLLGAGWTWPVEADGVDGVGVDGPGRWSLLVVPRWERVTNEFLGYRSNLSS